MLLVRKSVNRDMTAIACRILIAPNAVSGFPNERSLVAEKYGSDRDLTRSHNRATLKDVACPLRKSSDLRYCTT